ncbi:putative pyridoxal-dependent decarboxylase domain-containing protein 2 isoform X2 [Hydra vulgaris]|uniref:Pyridoxal-dependent decarboxylase domain-containing protein 1 n=1 Tax=Hydra vulgaris TaxID=6087 RepID=A0ABM4CD96_HYDVU
MAVEAVDAMVSQNMTDEQNISHQFYSCINRIFQDPIRRHAAPLTTHHTVVDDFHIDKGVSLSEILNRLASLHLPSTKRSSLPNTYNHISILSDSFQGYLQLLPSAEVLELSQQVKKDTTKWLSKLFGLDDVFSIFHRTKNEGLLNVCRISLHLKYSKYATDGFTALYTRPPVIYISAIAPDSLLQQLRSELGLPQSSICIVPCNSMFGSPYTMDISAFERHVTDDISCGKTPLLLIAYAGTPLSGHTDNLERLREICTQSGIWFHVEGDILANLALTQMQPSIQVATSADSLTLNLPTWFGLPNIPFCTFYKTRHPSSNSLVSMKFDQSEIVSLPLWVMLQFMGTHDLKRIIEHASELAQQISHRLDMMSSIKRLEQPSGVSPIVIFKYKASPSLPLVFSSESNLKSTKAAPRGKVDVSQKLVDACNEHLFNHLDFHSKVFIDLVNIPREGVCLKFHPLCTSRFRETSKADIDHFVEVLQNKIVELDHTLVLRTTFSEIFQRIPDLQVVDVSDVLALGAFQCLPKYWKTKNLSNLSEIKKTELNELNVKIFELLIQQCCFVEKCAMSNGQLFIKINVVDEAFDLQLFADRILKLTIDMEDNEKYAEMLKESVQKNIEEAMTKIEREREEKFFQDGVLRSVPIVSSLYNWWSPPPKEDHGVIGRSFDLSSGKLEATDKTYKFKMQLHDDQSDTLSHLSGISKLSHKESLKQTDLNSDDEGNLSEIDSTEELENEETENDLT